MRKRKNSGILRVFIMLYFSIFAYKQKLNRGIAACGEYFAINRMSKYASVLCNPEVHSEQSISYR